MNRLRESEFDFWSEQSSHVVLPKTFSSKNGELKQKHLVLLTKQYMFVLAVNSTNSR
jgi:hypothetical protein